MPARFPIGLVVALLSVASTNATTITGTSIASHCAMDSEGTIEQYQEYGNELAKTLGFLTAEELARVFGGSRNVEVPETLNEELDLGDIGFRHGSSKLSDAAKQELDKVYKYLLENPNMRVKIEGHTDFVKASVSFPLSNNRATKAREYLVESGIAEDRIESEGFGDSRPLVEDTGTNDTSPNRRIEIRVLEEE